MKTANFIAINFAPRHSLRLLLAPWWSWILLMIGITMSITALHLASDISTKAQYLDEAIQRQMKRSSSASARPQSSKKNLIPEAKAIAVNAAIQQLNLPWSDLLDAMEEATPNKIALISLEPDAKKHVLKVVAEALSSDDMIAYVEQLKKQAIFENVMLTKHELSEQDPQKPFRFQFEAQWREGAK